MYHSDLHRQEQKNSLRAPPGAIIRLRISSGLAETVIVGSSLSNVVNLLGNIVNPVLCVWDVYISLGCMRIQNLQDQLKIG